VNPIAIIIISATLTWVLCYPLRSLLLWRRIVDNPSQRSSHLVATPRGGGLAILGSLLLTILIEGVPVENNAGIWLVVATVLIGLVSFVDDIRSLPISFRFLCQSTAAGVVIAALRWRYTRLSGGGIWEESLLIGIQFLWLVGYTNAFNFMDGINGLAAGQAVITGFGAFLLIGFGLNGWKTPPALICIALVGASAGFFPHNALRARLFMGDIGSASLGFLLAALTLWVAQYADWYLLPPLVLLHSNFVLDTGITLWRRISRGDPWREAHREHFYQRLIRSGLGHSTVTLIEMGLQLVVLGLLLIYLQLATRGKLAIVAIVISIWLIFFAWADRRFRRPSTGQG
jgi:UDP-N-acetylmuramyl pentapeptide phosphotransferase/UDP-N-acetylglucosamine-1-phosphate transferase